MNLSTPPQQLMTGETVSPDQRTPVDWVLIAFILSQIMAGVLRWALGSIGLQALIYLPVALLWAKIALIMVDHFRRKDISRGTILLCCMIITSILVGFVSLPTKQVLFGTWVLTPLIYGYATGGTVDLSHPIYRMAAAAGLILACVGVFGDSQFNYPWIGANFELGGKEIAGAREWHIGEHRRLAGFSRSSFDAAGQITVLAVLLNTGLKLRVIRMIVWALAITAVGYTTARGVLLSMFVAIAAIELESLTRGLANRAATALGLLWISFPPLLAWSVDFSQIARLQLKASYGSYLDRMSQMWPEALQLLLNSPVPPLGRGLGGIGAAQTLFEPDAFNAADNLLVYQFVSLGALSLPLLFALFYGTLRFGTDANTRNAPSRALALIVIWYGAVSNIVEHPVLAVIYGLLLNHCFLAIRQSTVLHRRNVS